MCRTWLLFTFLNQFITRCRVTLEDLYSGKTTTVNVDRQVICAKCQG